MSEARAELAVEVTRLADRLRSLSEGRLARPLPSAGSRADAAHALAQALAVAAQGIEQHADASAPAWREVPRLDDFAVGDQIAVTGTDLVSAAAGLHPSTSVWTPHGRQPVGDVVSRCASALRELRLAL